MLKPYTVMCHDNLEYRIVCGPDFWRLASFRTESDAERVAALLNAYVDFVEGYDVDKFNAVLRELRGR